MEQARAYLLCIAAAVIFLVLCVWSINGHF
jgi:hypothetical protein